ncbi:MAG: hypothetical protein Q8919_05875, partial [Bacteroidota bacterium]|nr:hypothetical protein [Bacteroidota bacterium]
MGKEFHLLHSDSQTNLPATEYFFLGSGKIQIAIQWSRNPDATPLGILVATPENFTRKWGTYLFHPELGLERTMLTVIIDGIRYRPRHDDLTVEHSEYEGVPTVLAHWHAGECEVWETFSTSIGSNAFVRWINVDGGEGRRIEIETALYANPTLFSAFNQGDTFLYAAGHAEIYLAGFPGARTKERFLTIAPEPIERGNTEAKIGYAIGGMEGRLDLDEFFDREEKYWKNTSHVSESDTSLSKRIAYVFEAAKKGLRSAIASDGRFDASIWQYGMEWGRDAAMVAEALIYSGQFETAKIVLEHILTRLSNDQGMVAEASRFRGGADSELDSNGLVLTALHTYLEWTGDETLVKDHWQRICAIANYLLRPEFLDHETGLLKASRDISERNEALGIRPGYDVAHQTFGIVGLESAAALAQKVSDEKHNRSWSLAASKMREAFLTHKSHSLIAGSRIIKRRLLTGEVQEELLVERKKENEEFLSKFLPNEMPLGNAGQHLLEP